MFGALIFNYFKNYFYILGGYKGSGLAMMVELFCGILSGSHFGKNIRLWRDLDRKADLVNYILFNYILL